MTDKIAQVDTQHDERPGTPSRDETDETDETGKADGEAAAHTDDSSGGLPAQPALDSAADALPDATAAEPAEPVEPAEVAEDFDEDFSEGGAVGVGAVSDTGEDPVPRRGEDEPGRPRRGRRGRKHVLVREYVRSVIVNAEPGTPAPSERELAQQFNVARMTVRHAIDALVGQGLLERIPGKGTFVTKPLIDMQMRLSAYTEEMERRGKRPESRTLLARRESAGPGVARALDIEEGSAIAHWQRLRLADGVPMAIQHAYLSLKQFPNFLDEALPGSLYFWLAQQDLMPTWGEDSVMAAVADEDEADLLGLEPGAPVLHISRRAFCRDTVVEVTRSVYRADRYTLWVPVRRPDHLR